MSAVSIGTSPYVTSTSPVELGQRRERDLHGVAGAALLGLDDGGHVRRDLGEVGLDLLAQVPDHDDDVLGLQRGRPRRRRS